MRKECEGKRYPPYRLRPNRDLAEKYLASQGAATPLDEVPPTYMIFLRGESHGVDLFRDLDIPRTRALQGGQRYEWHHPIGWDDELNVTACVQKITEKTTKSGTLWFVDMEYEYRLARSGELALRETSRIIERG